MSIHDRWVFHWKTDELRQQKIKEEKERLMFNKGIEIFDLSNRTHKALKRSAINTIQDVINEWERIPDIRNFGKKCLGELKGKLFTYLEENGKAELIEDLLTHKEEQKAV